MLLRIKLEGALNRPDAEGRLRKLLLRAGIVFSVLALAMSFASDGRAQMHQWSFGFGEAGSSDDSRGVALDPSGNILMAGSFEGTADFGNGPVTSAGSADIVLAKYDPAGAHIWSQRFGSSSTEYGFDTDADAAGNVYLLGDSNGTVDFGGGPLTSSGSRDIVLAKFDTGGAHLWSKRIGTAGNDVGTKLVVDPNGNVLIGAQTAGFVDFGGGPVVGVVGAGGGINVMAKFDANGTHLWSFSEQGLEPDDVDAAGNIVSFGAFYSAPGEIDMMLSKYNSNGTLLWSQAYGDPGTDRGVGAAFDPAGNIVVSGRFTGTIDFGGGPLTGAGTEDALLAKFDGNGVHIWSQVLAGTGNERLQVVKVNASGSIAVGGFFTGTADFGGGSLTSAGGNDIILATYDANGVHQWSQRFGSTGTQDRVVNNGIVLEDSGALVAGGQFMETVDFGGGPITSAGSRDGFLARFAPPTVSVAGNVSANCSGGLLGVTVTLDADPNDPGSFMAETSTDASGDYSFTDVPVSTTSGELSIVTPLGYAAVSPVYGELAIVLNQDHTVDFSLECLTPVEDARSKGYWKHQAKVYVKGRGHAQETQADMETNYPAAIYNHFFENGLNAIEVAGVTYVDNGTGPEPLSLADIHGTLSVKGNAGMLAKAKQQYLAVLLNVASQRLLTSSIVSDDGATASQALQHIAQLIEDGDSSNDELAKDIGDTINNAQMVDAGVIPLTIDDISYRNAPSAQLAPPETFAITAGPNPFTDRTMVRLALPESGEYTFTVFDIAGRRIKSIAGHAQAGNVSFDWDGRTNAGERVAPGIYYYRATATGGESHTGRLILAR